MTAAPSVQPISRLRVAADLRGHRVLAGAELHERVEQRALDADEDHDGDAEDDLVERVDVVGVRRAAGLRRQEVRGRDAGEREDAHQRRREGDREDAATGAGVRRRPRRRGILFMRRSICFAPLRLARGRRGRSSSAAGNSGSRFSRNAATPSAKSLDSAISCCMRASSSSCVLQAGVQPGVELALGARVGPRRPGWRGAAGARRPTSSNSSSATTSLTSPQRSAVGGGHALAEHRHLGRAPAARARGDERRRAAVGDEADVARTRAGGRPTRPRRGGRRTARASSRCRRPAR